MLLLSADSPLVGLQTLIFADADASSKGGGAGGGSGAGNVATRTIAASPSAVRCLAREGKEEEEEEEEEERGRGGGCLVSYGWRRLPRLLPPAIRSSQPPLVRERTADGRLVISREDAAARHVCARKVKDRRLVLELVDDERSICGTETEAPPPQQRRRRWSHPLVGQEAKAPASTAGGMESAGAPTTSSPFAAAAAPPVTAEACFRGWDPRGVVAA